MAKTAVDDYSATAASNTDIDGLDATGATGLVKSGDNYTRSMMAHLKGKMNDLGAVNTVAGTADAITVTLSSAPTALVDGMRFTFSATAANTGATTLNVTPAGGAALGAKKLMKWAAGVESALAAGDIAGAGSLVEVIYDSAADAAAGAFILAHPATAITFATNAQAMQASSTTLSVNPANLANLYSIALGLAIEVADLKGSRLNMAGGIADAYDSETDVDTATSTNESYDPTNDLYSPSATSTTSYANSGGTGNRTGSITVTSSGLSIGGGSESNLVDGASADNTTDSLFFSPHTPSSGYFQFDFGSAVYIDEFKEYQEDNVANGTWKWTGSNTAGSGYVDVTASYAFPGATATKTTAATAPGLYRYYRREWVSGALSGRWIREFEFKISSSGPTADNMTLASNAFTATAVPTIARVAVFIDPQVSITINTDFTAEVSRDGGTTYTAVTLALVSNPVGTVEQYEGTVSIAAQPSGSSMKYRLKTLNNKDIDVTGTVFQWG